MNQPRKAWTIGVLGLVTVLYASHGIANPASPQGGDAIPFTVNERVKMDGRCAHLPKTPCTQIKVSYPHFEAIHSSDAIDSINRNIKQFLLQSASLENDPQTIEEAMVKFLKGYENSKQDFPHQGVWADEKTVEVLQNRSNLLSLQYSHYWYTGGAHPNSSRTYWNYNPKTGKQIQLADLFVEGYAPKLNRIAEKHFRQARELETNTSLNEVGFWFENDQFKVNTNFALAPGGLIFFFNTYEVSPYVMGPTEVVIPYGELKGLLKDQIALIPNHS
ncbi:DUF3298 and DUF4163 domain-containing protein [Acaryochloris marina]|uniref:DUF3298 domain-containing protein n=1 Tax=Acaryochloris marina (strain MBIC 11017) TaxID=329726 RepID=B0C8L5_ACAM1|nr:DUF3298 and DUF4163 domain-containing protein [Acaryochloris marina]ABW31277.1 conserved hypothetical protein [Acaryochloris marina MBIC11017]BDM79955.1 hypothetical protein AM10699_28230 [Acaryochloris marina MBIC10699]